MESLWITMMISTALLCRKQCAHKNSHNTLQILFIVCGWVRFCLDCGDQMLQEEGLITILHIGSPSFILISIWMIDWHWLCNRLAERLQSLPIYLMPPRSGWSKLALTSRNEAVCFVSLCVCMFTLESCTQARFLRSGSWTSVCMSVSVIACQTECAPHHSFTQAKCNFHPFLYYFSFYSKVQTSTLCMRVISHIETRLSHTQVILVDLGWKIENKEHKIWWVCTVYVGEGVLTWHKGIVSVRRTHTKCRNVWI